MRSGRKNARGAGRTKESTNKGATKWCAPPLTKKAPYKLNADMPKAGLDRKKYRSAKFGSWERSQSLDAQVAEAGRSVGLDFHQERMERTPHTFDAHRLIWLAEKEGVQDAVVEG